MILLEALWFFIPVGAANTAPIWIKRFHAFDVLDIPIDAGKSWRGVRIFGDHKTVRGYAIGYTMALVAVFLQVYLYQNVQFFRDISYIDYSTVNPWLWAALLGIGCLIGDSVKSFFKRQKHHPPGTTWVPFDQIDYVVGGIIGSMLIVVLEPIQYVVLFVVWAGLHPLSTWLGFKLKLKSAPI